MFRERNWVTPRVLDALVVKLNKKPPAPIASGFRPSINIQTSAQPTGSPMDDVASLCCQISQPFSPASFVKQITSGFRKLSRALFSMRVKSRFLVPLHAIAPRQNVFSTRTPHGVAKRDPPGGRFFTKNEFPSTVQGLCSVTCTIEAAGGMPISKISRESGLYIAVMLH